MERGIKLLKYSKSEMETKKNVNARLIVPCVHWGCTSVQKPAFNQPLEKWRGLLKLQHILLIAGLP